MAIKWQDILKIAGGGSVSAVFLIVMLMNLSGMQYSYDGDKTCGDCYSLISVNSSYWSICAEHSASNQLVYKKSPLSQTLWVNLDKISVGESIVSTVPQVATEILVPTTKTYSTVKSDEYGYLRPLKDGDCFIKRKTKSNNQSSRIIIHAVEPVFKSVKWSFVLSDYLMQDISIDPWWNTSYIYRRDIINETTNLVSVSAINGTGTFLTKTVWANAKQCGGDLSLYYNSSSLYAVACNDSSLANFETEGSGLNNSPMSLYASSEVGVWHLTNALDSTSYGRNGTVDGATTTTSGKYGGAYVFDGANDAINFSNTAGNFTSTTPFSVSFWASFTKNTLGSVISKMPTEAPCKGWEVLMCNNSCNTATHPNIVVQIINSYPSDWLSVRSNTTALTINTWYNVVVTYNGTTDIAGTEIYINGVKQAKVTMNNNLTADFSNAGKFKMGSRDITGATANLFFNGTIDEVRLWSKVLSAAEVEELYNNSQNLNMLFDSETTVVFNQSIPDSTVQFGSMLLLQVNCSAGSTITYTDNTSLFVIGSSTGLINYTPSSVADIGNNIPIRITCTTPTGSATDDFLLNITGINATSCSFQTDGTKYEYEHTMKVNNITTDGTVCLDYEWNNDYVCFSNVTGTNLTYDMNTTKYWQFNDSTNSKMINSTQTAYFIVDNRTDILSGSINISGVNQTTYPENATLKMNGNIFATWYGELRDTSIYNKYFRLSNVFYSSVSTAFTSAGSTITFYIPISTNNGDNHYDNNDSLTFSVLFTGAQSNNGITSSVTDAYNVSNSGYTVDNVTMPSNVDDFSSSNTLDKNGSLWTSSTSGSGNGYCSGQSTSITGGNMVHTGGATGGFYGSVTCSQFAWSNASHISFNAVGAVNVTFKYNYTVGCGHSKASMSCGGGYTYYLIDEQGSYITLYTRSWSGGDSASYTSPTYNVSFYKSGNNMIVVENGGTVATVSHTSLNQSGEWHFESLGNVNAYCSNEGCGGSGSTATVQDVNISLPRLSHTSMQYVTSPTLGTIRSRTTTGQSANVSSAYVSWDSQIPQNTSIRYYVSANNGTNWDEALTSGSEIALSVPGNMTTFKLVYNSTNANMSPVNHWTKIEIAGRKPENVSIDLGADGSIEATITGNLSAYQYNYSTQPSYFWSVASDESDENAIAYVPIRLDADSAGGINITNINLTYAVNPVNIWNVSAFLENFNGTANITWIAGTGNITLSALSIPYLGNYLDFTVVCDGYNATSTVATEQNVSIYFSNFNVSLPSGVLEWAIYPITGNDKNVQPFGQNRGFTGTNGIYNITSLAYDTNISVYRYYNESTSRNNSSNWCYQETANVSTSCGGLGDGGYTLYNSSPWNNPFTPTHLVLYDGNWSSYGYMNGSGTGSVRSIGVEAAYKKPTGALNTSLYQIKYGSSITENKSFTTNCWVGNGTHIRITLVSQWNPAVGNVTYGYCDYGTNYSSTDSFFSTPSTVDNHIIYEEGMWWDFPCWQTATSTNWTGTYTVLNNTRQRVNTNISVGGSQQLWDKVNLTNCSGWIDYGYNFFDGLCDGCVETWT